MALNPYSRIRQQISYIRIGAPNFPAEDQTSLDQEFDRLTKLVDEILGVTKDAAKRGLLDATVRELRLARELYGVGDAAQATAKLEAVEKRLQNTPDKA